MKTGQEYWEELKEEGPVGEIDRELTIRMWEDCQRDMVDSFAGLIGQAKLCYEVYKCEGLGDSFVKPEMEKLEQELREL